MELTSGYSMILPILPAEIVGDGTFRVGSDINGTCFSIGGKFMLTAGHVADSNPTDPNRCLVVGIQGPDGFFKSARVTEVEKLPCDLGILRVEFVYPESENWFHRLQWSTKTLHTFEPVRGSGYPYGMHVMDAHHSVVVRGFQGHIVAGVDNFRPLGMDLKPFGIYELSFMAPRGLSGAPLTNSSGKVLVHGVIIGNSQSRMLIFRSSEMDQDHRATTVLEQYEALTLGIATRSEEVLRQSSSLLGGTVEDHLRRFDLLQNNLAP